MRIWEIDLDTDNKKYRDNQDGYVWTVIANELRDNQLYVIGETYNLKDILEIDFTEVIDWSKVAVDTPVWVGVFSNQEYHKRHFSHCEGKHFYCFDGGKTSHTINDKISITQWEICSLTDPNKGE